MNKETIIRVLKLVPNVIDSGPKIIYPFQTSYRLKEYLQYGNDEIPTGNYYTMEEVVKLLRGTTRKNVNININNSKIEIDQNKNRIFQYTFKEKYNLQPMISSEKTIINAKSEELQKRIQELAIIIPEPITITQSDEVMLFENILDQVALEVHKRENMNENMKLQRNKNFVKATGILAAIATASLIGAKAVEYISEQQQNQRKEFNKDVEGYSSRDHNPEHGPLYSAQEIIERYELEQQYLEEQQNNFKEGKTR